MSVEPIETDPSLVERIPELIGIIAKGMSTGLGFPLALSWSIILLLILTIIYILILLVEKFMQIFRYLLFFFWVLTAIAVVVITTQF